MNFGHMCFFNDENEFRKIRNWAMTRLSDIRIRELRKNGKYKKIRKAR